jgi:tRNA nucleotidyltransferase (CCA-adding enzyme)
MSLLTKKEILQKVKPNERESKQFELTVSQLVLLFEEVVEDLGFKCNIFVGGSFGKGTYLKGSFDVDLFFRFDKRYEEEELSRNLERALKSTKLIYKKQKGSRDYFSGTFSHKKVSINFEAIPVLKIKNELDARNSTDLSVFHVDFIKSKIKENPDLSDEIRLAKQYFKAKELYGAESYIEGFSGHVIDILIAHYGSLKDLLLSAKEWDEITFIDINNFYEDQIHAMKELEKDKHSCLVVVDPIMKDRNAARALSVTNYNKFLIEVLNFKDLNYDDFVIKNESVKSKVKKEIKFFRKNSFKVLVYKIKFDIKNDSEDIVGSKLKRLSKILIKYFEDFDFKVFNSDFLIDMKTGDCVFIYTFENTTISDLRVINGPKIFMKVPLKNFLKVRKNFFVDEDRVSTYEKRKFTDLKQIMRLDKEDFKTLLNREVDFIKKVTIKLKK